MPNGEITSKQLRVLGEQLKPFGDELGVGDITSRYAQIEVGNLDANKRFRGAVSSDVGVVIEMHSLRCMLRAEATHVDP